MMVFWSRYYYNMIILGTYVLRTRMYGSMMQIITRLAAYIKRKVHCDVFRN